MRLYAIVTSDRPARPARKGGDQELTTTLSEGNRPVAHIRQRPGKLEISITSGVREIILNGQRWPAKESRQKV